MVINVSRYEYIPSKTPLVVFQEVIRSSSSELGCKELGVNNRPSVKSLTILKIIWSGVSGAEKYRCSSTCQSNITLHSDPLREIEKYS